MAVKSAGYGVFTEFLTNHILGHKNRNELLSIVHTKGQTHELGNDGGPSGPCFNHIFATGLADLIGLLEQVSVDKWAFPN